MKSNRLCIFVGLSMLAAGCAERFDPPQPSGFLGDHRAYEQLTLDPKTGSMRYVKAPGVLQRFTAFAVDPVKVYMVEESGEFHVYQREIDEMAYRFRERVIRSLGDSYSVLTGPAKDKAIIRAALVNVTPNHPLFNVRPSFGGTPGLGVGGASIEAEIVDSVTGERLVAVMDKSVRENTNYMSGFKKWGSTEEAFDAWASELSRAIRSGKQSSVAMREFNY